jgi:hypothetical protein
MFALNKFTEKAHRGLLLSILKQLKTASYFVFFNVSYVGKAILA